MSRGLVARAPSGRRAQGQGRESEKDLDVGAVEELLFGWLKG